MLRIPNIGESIVTTSEGGEKLTGKVVLRRDKTVEDDPKSVSPELKSQIVVEYGAGFGLILYHVYSDEVLGYVLGCLMNDENEFTFEIGSSLTN